MKPNRPSSPDDILRAENELFNAVLALKTIDEARDFFSDLCTPAERQALVDRWMVVEPLMTGDSYREISQKTGVSVTTIGRVARFLTQGSGGYQRVFNRLKKSNGSKSG